jgi:hypothetical protein
MLFNNYSARRSDEFGRKDTLVSGLTGFTDTDFDINVTNLSGSLLIDQQRKADMKLQLLQK